MGIRQQLDKVSLDEMTIGYTKVKTTTSARSLGVWFDHNMQLHTNIPKMYAMVRIYLYNIRRIRKHLTYELTRALTRATIIAPLDYCNSLLYGCSDGQIKILQRLQNMAARLLCNSTRFCRITPLLFKLHWLPVKLRTKYKMLLNAYKVQFKSTRNHDTISDLMMNFYWLHQLLNQTRQQETAIFKWLHPLNGVNFQNHLDYRTI